MTKAQQYSEVKSTSYVTAQQQRGCYNNSLLNSKGSHDYLTSPPSRPQASHQWTRITRTVLGNPLLQVLQKGLKGWITEATPICNESAYALRMHVTSLHPAVVDMFSNDEVALSSDGNDVFSPISFPPGFQPALMPPNGTMFVPLDPASQQMIGQHIPFKWPTYGWCLGRISVWNTNPKTLCHIQTLCGTRPTKPDL